MKITCTKQQILTVISSTIIMVILGSIYTFGAMIPYTSSYLYYQGHETSSATLSIVYTLATMNMNVGMIIDSLLTKHLDNQKICFISLFVLGVSIFITSFMNELVGYIIFFGIFNGIGIGIGYLCPLKNAYHFFPNRKGLCAGFCMAGLGFGSVIFNQIIIFVINPDNIQIDPDTQRFPEEVASRVPLAFQFLAAVYLFFGFIGCFLMPKPKITKTQIKQKQSLISSEGKIQSEEIPESNGEVQKINSIQLYVSKKGHYITLIILTMPFAGFIAFAYKQLGFILNPDFSRLDHQITIVGSIGILSNGFSRYVWGFLFDYFSFRKLITIMNLAMIVSIFTLQLTVKNIYLYAIPVIISFISLGGMFSMLPTQTTRIFGQTMFAKMYWLSFLGFSLGSLMRFLCQILIINQFDGKDGYIYCIYIFGVLQVISAFLCFFTKFEYTQEQEMKLRK